MLPKLVEFTLEQYQIYICDLFKEGKSEIRIDGFGGKKVKNIFFCLV
jgi:hypothetical protein